MDEVNHRLASLFNNIGNGVRIEILDYLMDVDEANLKEISTVVDRKNPTMSRHMKILADYDLVRSETRGRKKFFKIKRYELVKACLDIRNLLKRNDDGER